LKRVARVCCIAALLAAGCADSNSPPPPPAPPTPQAPPPVPANSTDRVIAHLNGDPITLNQLLGPLIESHGLTVLVNLLQVQLAREDAAKAGVTVTDADFQAERESTLAGMFKDAGDQMQDQIDAADAKNDTAESARLHAELDREYDQLLGQLLDKQHISRPEFDMMLQINTYLRKIAEPVVNRSITEQSLRAAFSQLYGETVVVRDIQLANQQELAEAQRRLARGDKFEDVAESMSHNRQSAELGGELPRFSREAPGFAENFKDVAFGLQPGQVSDPVEADGSFHLIKMENRFAPRAVKYETVRDSVRRQLFDAAIKSAVINLRQDLARRVLDGLRIDDPVLSKQFEQRVDAREAQAREREKIRQDLDRERATTTAPATPAPIDAPPATTPAAGQ